MLRVSGSSGQVLVTDKSQFKCPQIERIHFRVGHPELLGVFISTKLSVFDDYHRLPREFIRNLCYFSEMTCYDGLEPREPEETGTELKSRVQKQTQAAHFSAAPRLLRTRLWHLSNLQRAFHTSTHGSVHAQLSRIPKKLFYYNGNQLPKDPCALAGIKRCKCTVILQVSSTSSSSLSLALLLLFFFGFNSAAARSARSMRTRHSPQHTTLKLDTLARNTDLL